MLRRRDAADEPGAEPVTLFDAGGTWSTGARRVPGTDAVVPVGSHAVVRAPLTRRQTCCTLLEYTVCLAGLLLIGYAGGHVLLDVRPDDAPVNGGDVLPWQRAAAALDRGRQEREIRRQLRDDELRALLERVHQEDRLGHGARELPPESEKPRNDSAEAVHRRRLLRDPLYAELYAGERSTAGLRRLGPLGTYRLALADPQADALRTDTRGDELHTTLKVLVAPPLYGESEADNAKDPSVPPPEHRWLAAVRGPELTTARHVRVTRRSPHAEEYELGVTVTRPGRYELDLAVLLPAANASAANDADRVVPVFRRVALEIRGRPALEQAAHALPVCTLAWAPGRWLRHVQGYAAVGDDPEEDTGDGGGAQAMDAWLRADGDAVYAPYHCRLALVVGERAHECLQHRNVDGVVVRGAPEDGAADFLSALLDTLGAPAAQLAAGQHAVVDGVYVGWLPADAPASLLHTPYGAEPPTRYQVGHAPLPRPPQHVVAVQLGGGNATELAAWTQTLPDVKTQLWWGDEPLWQRANASAPLHWRVWPRLERWHRTLYSKKVQVLGAAALEDPLLYALSDDAARRRLVWRQAVQLWWAGVCAEL